MNTRKGLSQAVKTNEAHGLVVADQNGKVYYVHAMSTRTNNGMITAAVGGKSRLRWHDDSGVDKRKSRRAFLPATGHANDRRHISQVMADIKASAPEGVKLFIGHLAVFKSQAAGSARFAVITQLLADDRNDCYTGYQSPFNVSLSGFVAVAGVDGRALGLLLSMQTACTFAARSIIGSMGISRFEGSIPDPTDYNRYDHFVMKAVAEEIRESIAAKKSSPTPTTTKVEEPASPAPEPSVMDVLDTPEEKVAAAPTCKIHKSTRRTVANAPRRTARPKLDDAKGHTYTNLEDQPAINSVGALDEILDGLNLQE